MFTEMRASYRVAALSMAALDRSTVWAIAMPSPECTMLGSSIVRPWFESSYVKCSRLLPRSATPSGQVSSESTPNSLQKNRVVLTKASSKKTSRQGSFCHQWHSVNAYELI